MKNEIYKGNKLIPVLLNWFFPGTGFFFLNKRVRAVVLFILLEVTFLIGFILHSQVALPMINPNSVGFNLINIFTFIVQLGNGFTSLLSIINDKLNLGLFWANPAHHYYELGGYYMLVSGAANYFITMHVYDTLCGRIKKKDDNEEQEESSQK